MLSPTRTQELLSRTRPNGFRVWPNNHRPHDNLVEKTVKIREWCGLNSFPGHVRGSCVSHIMWPRTQPFPVFAPKRRRIFCREMTVAIMARYSRGHPEQAFNERSARMSSSAGRLRHEPHVHCGLRVGHHSDRHGSRARMNLTWMSDRDHHGTNHHRQTVVTLSTDCCS